MEKGRIEFSMSFHQPWWNSKQNGNVKTFFYINLNCIFSKTIWRKKRCNPIEKGRIEFSTTLLEPGGNSEQNDNVQIFFYITQIAYLTSKQFHYGAKPLSQPAYILAV